MRPPTGALFCQCDVYVKSGEVDRFLMVSDHGKLSEIPKHLRLETFAANLIILFDTRVGSNLTLTSSSQSYQVSCAAADGVGHSWMQRNVTKMVMER